MPELETVAILVPVDLEAGDLFKVTLEWGATFTIQVPEGSTGGDTIAVDLPTFESVAAEIDELDSVRAFVDELSHSRKIESFLLEHAGAFGDELSERGEYPLHYTEIHAKFVCLVEAQLEQFLASQGLDSEGFVYLVQRSGAESRDALLRAIDGVTDFEAFLSLMLEAKQGDDAAAAAPAEAAPAATLEPAATVEPAAVVS